MIFVMHRKRIEVITSVIESIFPDQFWRSMRRLKQRGRASTERFSQWWRKEVRGYGRTQRQRGKDD